MSRPLVILIPHRLGKEEALRRLKSGLADVQSRFRLLTVEEEVWADDQLQFRVNALGQGASGKLEVKDDHVKFELMLSGLLGSLADKLGPVISAEGKLLLGKK